MILDELILHNFGIYRGRQRFDLSVTVDRPIVLIGGLNGNGKSTFVDALHLGFFGKMARCSARNGLGYKEFLRRSINRSVNPTDGAAIEIAFRQTSGAEQSTYYLHRSWYATGTSLRERFYVLKDGQEDGVLTGQWQEYLEEIFPARVAPLFFFDGEKIEEFADPKTSCKILSSAIHALLGLDIVERLNRDLEVLERRKKTLRLADQNRVKVDEENIKIREAQDWLASLRERRAGINTKLARAQKQLEEAHQNFSVHGGDVYNRREELREGRGGKAAQVVELEKQLRKVAADILPLTLVGGLLDDLVRQDEQEKDGERADAVLSVVEGRDSTLVGLLEEAKVGKETIGRVNRFLRTERESFQESAAANRYINLTNQGRLELIQLVENEITASKQETLELLSAFEVARSDLDVIDRQLESVPAAETVRELAIAVDTAEAACSEMVDKLYSVDQDIEVGERKLAESQSVLTKLLEGRISKILEQEDVERLLVHSSRVRETLDRFRRKVVQHHITRLEQLILESLYKLMRKDLLIMEVKIDPSTFSVSLRDNALQSLEPEQLSAGERQLFALALLWALGKATGRPAPTVIDTPLGRLDSVHRHNLIERYFPEASHQVILLSTDKEIDATALELLGPKLNRRYRIEYDAAIGGSAIINGYFFEETA